MGTVKLDLGDGDYAVLFSETKHKTTRALQKLVRDTLGLQKYTELQSQLFNAKTNEEKRIILSQLPVDGDDIVTLLNQVESWSFGEVSQATIDNMPETKYQLLLTEVNKLYSFVPLAVSK
jgi:hypothetical protein